MLYLDTSLLVAILAREKDSERLDAWLDDQKEEDVAISDWVMVEFSAALSIKVRMKQIEPEHRTDIVNAFQMLSDNNFLTLQIDRTHFIDAAQFANQFSYGLRAADALHLAICATAKATLCTLDQRLSIAGAKLGIATVLV